MHWSSKPEKRGQHPYPAPNLTLQTGNTVFKQFLQRNKRIHQTLDRDYHPVVRLLIAILVAIVMIESIKLIAGTASVFYSIVGMVGLLVALAILISRVFAVDFE